MREAQFPLQEEGRPPGGVFIRDDLTAAFSANWLLHLFSIGFDMSGLFPGLHTEQPEYREAEDLIMNVKKSRYCNTNTSKCGTAEEMW